MKNSILIAEFLSQPWALMPERIQAMARVLVRWEHNLPRAMEDDDARPSRNSFEARRAGAQARAGGGAIAVLPLYGVVVQRANLMDDVCGPGATSTQQFAGALREALADESIGSILIDIDSPGGSVYGVAELAEEIYQARAKKPVVAIANSLSASAAYWIGCSASEFYVTPGGEAGSIGVWQAHQDYSIALEAEGVKTTLISAGKYKVEGNPYQPLDAEAQGFMQSRVNDYYQAFTKGVARGRGVGIAQVRDGMGQGRVLGADAALAEKMVDGIATFDEVVRKMQKSSRDARAGRAASRLNAAQARLAIAQRTTR
jgi:signal peptide peptidase SppA